MASKTDNLGNDWVKCDSCQDWVMYENSNLKTPFQELERKKKEKFSCRACRAEERIMKLENQLKKLEATAAATRNTVENRTRVERR